MSDGVGRSRRIEDVGAGLAVGDQPVDRPVQVGEAVQQVLAPGGEHEPAPTGDPGGGRDALCGGAERVEQPGRGIEVLDGASRRAGLGQQRHRLGDAVGSVGEAPFRVDAERHVDGTGERGRVFQQLVAGDLLVALAERCGVTGAGGGQGRESEGDEEAGRTDVPGVRHDERPTLVQLPEAFGHGHRDGIPQSVGSRSMTGELDPAELDAADDPEWPAIPVAGWVDTRDTFHLWTQIVGKVRMAHTPAVNHWWNVPLYVTARGFTTSLIHHRRGGFTIEFDLVDHFLRDRPHRRRHPYHDARASNGG